MPTLALSPKPSLTLDDASLSWSDALVVQEFKTRARGELAPVALDPSACVPADAIQYSMYNGVCARDDYASLQASPVQYELTLLPSLPLGKELPKTFGHIHNALAPDAPTFSELYEVLYGVAHFLYYTLDPSKSRATFCGWTEARAGQQLVMPPDLYHLTINAGAGPLLFADVISKRARGIYDDVRATHGAPYFQLLDGTWISNSTFTNAASLTPCPQLLLHAPSSLYAQFAQGSLHWLDDPAQFAQRFPHLELPFE